MLKFQIIQLKIIFNKFFKFLDSIMQSKIELLGLLKIMKDWTLPSLAFLVFLYGVFFVIWYIYDYKNSNVSVFSNVKTTNPNESNIDNFLKEISNSFK